MSTQITYSPIKWRNNQDTALNAENLNSMDQGIVSAISEINKLHKEDERIDSRIDNFGVDNLHENYNPEKPYGVSHVIFNAGDSSNYIPYASDDPLNVTNIKPIYGRHTQKYDTEANWNRSNFIPAPGEIVIGTGKQTIEQLIYDNTIQGFKTESTTVDGFKLKIGDGENTWNNILELKGTQGPQGPQGKFQVINSVTVEHIDASGVASAYNTYPDPTKEETKGEVYTHLTLKLPRAYGSKNGEVIITHTDAGTDPNVIITENKHGVKDPNYYVYDYEFQLPKAPQITLAEEHIVLNSNEIPSVKDTNNNKYAPCFQFSIPRGYGAKFVSSSIALGKSGTQPAINIEPKQNDTQGTFDHSLNLTVPRGYDSKIRNVDFVELDAGIAPSVEPSQETIYEEDQGIHVTDLTFKLPKAPQVEVNSEIEILDVNASPIVIDENNNKYSPKFKFSLPRANSITNISKLKEEKVEGILTSTYDIRLLNNTSAGTFEVQHGVGIETIECDQTSEPSKASHLNFILTNGDETPIDIYNGTSIESVNCEQNNNAGEASKITIDLSTGESTSFNVYNGISVESVKCEQNDTPGEASKLTVKLSNGETTEFNVYNGKHGEVYWHTF